LNTLYSMGTKYTTLQQFMRLQLEAMRFDIV